MIGDDNQIDKRPLAPKPVRRGLQGNEGATKAARKHLYFTVAKAVIFVKSISATEQRLASRFFGTSRPWGNEAVLPRVLENERRNGYGQASPTGRKAYNL